MSMSGPAGSPVREHWDDILEDMAAMAEEYRDAGWEAVECHSGDVTPLPPVLTDPGMPEELAETAPEADDEFGLDVLLPDDEFERVQALVEDVTFDECEVYNRAVGGVVFCITVNRASDDGVALFVPYFYRPQEAREMFARAGDLGELHTRLRPLSDDEAVTLVHDDPGLFIPEGEDPVADRDAGGEDAGGDAADGDAADGAAAGRSDDGGDENPGGNDS